MVSCPQICVVFCKVVSSVGLFGSRLFFSEASGCRNPQVCEWGEDHMDVEIEYSAMNKEVLESWTDRSFCSGESAGLRCPSQTLSA